MPGGQRLVALREAGAPPSLPEALERVAAQVARWAGRERLGLAGVPPRALAPGGIAEHLEEVLAGRERGEPAVVCLGDGTGRHAIQLFWDQTGAPHQALEHVWTAAAPAAPAFTPELLDAVAEAFGAFSAFTEDAAVLAGTRAERAFERARAHTPPELRAHLPEPPADAGLPQLLVPEEYDRRLAPDGVFWLNRWSAEMVRWVGEERVRTAPWAEVAERAGGALRLTATPRPLDPARDRDLLAELLRALDLRGAQERCRFE
jgi:hypothetical protein